MISPIQFDAGKTLKLPLATSTTLTKGMAVIWTSGYIALAVNTTEDVYGVALQDKVSTSDNPDVLILPVDPSIRFEGDCDGVVSIVDRGTRCDLADNSNFNPDAVTEKVFLIEEIVGAAEVSTKVRGRFCRFTAT